MLQLAPDLAVHLESPLALPHCLTQVAISGWIICRRPIGQVEIQPGRQSLTLIDRPDVRAVYPDYPYVSGYIGIVPTASLTHTNTLTLAFDVERIAAYSGFQLGRQMPPFVLAGEPRPPNNPLIPRCTFCAWSTGSCARSTLTVNVPIYCPRHWTSIWKRPTAAIWPALPAPAIIGTKARTRLAT